METNLDTSQLSALVGALASEKGLESEQVHAVIEEAILAAYKRELGVEEVDMSAFFDAEKNDITIMVDKLVVDDVKDDVLEISPVDAKKIDKDANVGDHVKVKVKPQSFGRVASQTAKQVIIQKLREIERETIMTEFEDKIGSIVNGVVQKVERSIIFVDLGKATGIIPMREQIRGEFNSVGARIKAYLKGVEKGQRGPQLILSRACPEFVEELFKSEVPETENGSVVIKGVAREGGGRTKIAVDSTVKGVDAVGTFVGSHGIRVQAVQGEIGDREKIDIIPYSEDIVEYITKAMAPTEIAEVKIDHEKKEALVYVDESQLSVAIGKAGQNVRLASRLTDHEIVIKQLGADEPEKPVHKKLASKAQLEGSLLDAIESAAEEETTDDDPVSEE